MVEPRDFLVAFKRQWGKVTKHDRPALLAAMDNKRAWTAYMQQADRAFLRQVGERLQLRVYIERDRIDVSYCDQRNHVADLYSGWYLSHPTRWDVLIEHENDVWPEEELYKLLMRHAPLKVLIFYDWSVEQKERNERRREWVSEKMRKLYHVGRAVSGAWPEAKGTAYVVLIGQVRQEDHPYEWRYIVVQGKRGWLKQIPDFQPLTDLSP